MPRPEPASGLIGLRLPWRQQAFARRLPRPSRGKALKDGGRVARATTPSQER